MSDSARPPILLLHSVFGTPELMSRWATELEAAGYRVHVPAMPGREPTDDAVLARTGIDQAFDVALAAYDAIGEPAVVIGHSMGGLLAQKIAAARTPRAVVTMASIPPGVLWFQLKPLPHLFRVLPKVLAGQPFLPSAKTMREVPLSTLPAAEQDELVPRLVRDSGRMFREMSLGSASTRVDAAEVTCPMLCVSGGSDRNVAPWISRRVAARYGAEHQVHPNAPHWIVADSLVGEVLPPILEWLNRTVGQTAVR
ncbi:alpha/beta hydrolase [Mycolicibacterium arenosum]|uniref:S9 family peptidase n=1 Tax=Mycolicibacterium arenosum TaxID=2952157 RepID=A0ABT1M197_9MYCO|nr:alpha/beta fold hydrolase [Mycolicibacterium sp. CAU 1645]MCP9272919.1 S9 family peptidase [Mycolicibacterium sp. CAU 1645]